jgi:hypothetical protein
VSTSPAPTKSGNEFWSAFDAERARVLRRRIMWYAGVMMTLLGFAFLGGMINFLNPTYTDGSPRRTLFYEVISTGSGLFIYLIGFVLVRVRKPNRHQLVFLVTIITTAAAILVSIFQTLAIVLDEPQSKGGMVPDNDPTHASVMSIINPWFVQAMACLLLPMPLRESLRFSIPAFLTVPATSIFIIGGSTGAHIFWSICAAIAMAVPLAWSAWRYREMDQRFAAQQQLAKFDEVSSELAYARRIHEALFPPPITRGPVRMHYTYEPMREIGGDFLFVWPLHVPPSATPEPITVVLIDVSGHGVAAALAVNRFHGELRRFFAVNPQGTPAQLITTLNQFAFEELAPQAVFATAICVRIDPSTNTVHVANAGHPPAFLSHRGTRTITPLAATATMLGVLPPEAFSSDPCELPFTSDDNLIMYTDGLSETANNANDFFGEENIREIIRSDINNTDNTDNTDNPHNTHAALAKAASKFRSGAVRDDLLVVQISAATA